MINLYFTLALVFVLFIAVLDKKFLLLHELNKHHGAIRMGLGTYLFVRGVIVAVILVALILSVPLALIYPTIPALSKTTEYGTHYANIILWGHIGFVFVSILKKGIGGYRDVLKMWARGLTRLWLAGLNQRAMENYDRHGAWRWAVIGRRVNSWLISRGSASVHVIRAMWLLGSGGIAILLAPYVISKLDANILETGLISLPKLIESPQSLAGVVLILGIPIAFTVWYFRDQNNVWQIENGRKDINLKDFQKLAEWAAGLHLPEDKISETVKQQVSSKLGGTGDKIESSVGEEKTKSLETTDHPKSGVMKTYSRRDGAVALQISAIFQLQAFLRGDFGSHFQRPAFQLLKSVWIALTRGHIEGIAAVSGNTRLEYRNSVTEWRKQLVSSTHEGVGKALTLALSGGAGAVLRAHSVDLPQITLAGLQGVLPGKFSARDMMVLDGMDFSGAQLQGISLGQAFLSKINLSSAGLFGVEMTFAHLQAADLRWAHAAFSNFSGARMQGAVLDGAVFFGADLFVVDLRGASLDGTRLQSALLNGAKLEGARLLNITYDDSTDFTGASVDEFTVVAVATLKDGVYNSAQRKFPDDFVVDHEATQSLRSALAMKGLILPTALF